MFRSKSKCYKAQKVQKYALNSQLQALQNLTNDDEVENWRLSSFLLAVLSILIKAMILKLNQSGTTDCHQFMHFVCKIVSITI